MSDITGSLTLVGGDQRTTHELTPTLLAEWMPFRAFRQFARFETQGLRYEPALPGSTTNTNRGNAARQREHSEWLLWAEPGDPVRFCVMIRPVGKGDPKPVPVSLVSPSGDLTNLVSARGEGETAYEFKAAERGAHKIICEPRSWTATVNSSTSRLCLFSRTGTFHFLSTTGQFYFWVPPATKEFGVKVSGGGGAECVKAALMDPAGNKVAEYDNIGQAQQFLAAGMDGSRGEMWSLRFEKPSEGVLEDYYVHLQGLPPLLSTVPTALLKPAR